MNLLDLAYVLSMGIAFCSIVNSQQFVPTIVSYGIVFFWMAVAFIKFIKFSGVEYYGLSEHEYTACALVFKYNNYVRVLIYIYTLLIIFLGIGEKRFLSANLQTFINGLSAISAVYIFRKRTLKNSISALIMAYLISLIYGLVNGGELTSNTLSKIFEMHDIAFSIGIIFLYFLCFAQKGRKNMHFFGGQSFIFP